MSRCISQNGKFFRMRRGILVQIPPEWVGVVPNRMGRGSRNQSKLYKKLQNSQERTKLKKELSEILGEL